MAAKELLLRQQIKAIKAHRFHAGEARAARQARELLAKGDANGALAAARRQMLQHEMARQAITIQDRVQKVMRSFGRFFARDEALGKRRDVQIINIARGVLAAYKLYSGTVDIDAKLAIVAKQNPELYGRLSPLIDTARKAAKPWSEMTYGEFLDLNDTVSQLWKESEASRQITLAGVRHDREDFKRQLITSMEAKGIPKTVPGLKSLQTMMLDSMALLTQMEHWCRWMDGGEVGPWSMLYREVQEGLNRNRFEFRGELEKMVKILKGLKFKRGTIDATEQLGYVFGSESGGYGEAELFGAMLHEGNLSNLRKNLKGRGWVPDPRVPLLPNGEIDTGRWDTFKQWAIEKGYWDQKRQDAVQALWDLNKALLPKLQDAHHAAFGFNFEEVTPRVFDVAWKDGTTTHYEGGYVPAYPDLEVEVSSAKYEQMEDLQADLRNVAPVVSRGMTISRKDFDRALFLDARQLTRHVDNVLRLIHVAPAVRQWLSLVRDPEVAGPLNKMNRVAVTKLVMPWLVRVATQKVTLPGASKALDAAASFLKRSNAAAIMFLKPANAAQQIVGIINTINFVPAKYVLPMAWRSIKHPFEMVNAMVAKSPHMAEVTKNQVQDLQATLREVLHESTDYAAFKAWVSRNTYVLQRFVQNRANVVSWWAAYNQSIVEQGKTLSGDALEKRAVADADSIVRLSQGANEAEAIAAYRVSTPVVQTFLMFTGYWNTVLNGIVYSQNRLKAGLLLLSFPTIVSGAIMLLAAGGLGDQDDDGDTDAADFTRWILSEQMKAGLALVPVVGPAVSTAAEGVLGRNFDEDRLVNNPAIRSIAATVRALQAIRKTTEGRELTARDWRDITTAVSAMSGIPITPLANPAIYAGEVGAGRVEPGRGLLPAPLDYARGILTGRAAPGTRVAR